VFDHFHVVKLFNDKLSAFRRQLYYQLDSDDDRKILKGTRRLLLKNPENLDPKRNELQRLEEALRLNAPLAAAYCLRGRLKRGQAPLPERPEGCCAQRRLTPF
jgi:transposase